MYKTELFGLLFFIKGFILGFAIAAPIGPIGILCAKRTLQQGRKAGYISGLGAGLADALYASLGASGLAAISHFLEVQKFWIHLFGGILLLSLGVKFLLEKPLTEIPQITLQNSSAKKNFFSTFALTFSNPLTFIAFTSAFAASGVGLKNHSFFMNSLVVLGVFAGSALWWFLLCYIVDKIKHTLPLKIFNAINKTAGLIILIFGFISLLKIL